MAHSFNTTYSLLASLFLSSAAIAGGPFLEIGTYAGGPSNEESSNHCIAPDGSVYIIGRAIAPELNGPLPNALNSLSGGMDIFVIKMTADLSDVIWSRYVGGMGQFHHIEHAADCAPTADGGVVVVGRSETPDFPTVNALDSTLGGDNDAVLFKLDADGSIVFSTYIGGSDDDGGDSDDDNYGEVEIAPDGSIFIAGFTRSADFPLVNPIDSTFGGFQADVYVMKLSADAQNILASTFLGDEFRDQVFGMELDSQGRPVIVGDAGPGWPYTSGAYTFGTPSSSGIVYVTKLASDAQSIEWSARIDAVDSTGGHLIFEAMAIGPDDTVTAVGYATGEGFPVPADAYQNDLMSGSPTRDAVALVFSADGSSVVGGTFLGAINVGETSRSVGIDSHGNVLMAKVITSSPPTPAQLYKFNSAMTTLLEPAILVAPTGSFIRSLSVTEENNAMLLVHTSSGPTTPGAFQTSNPGGITPYLALWNLQDPPTQFSPGDVNGDGSVTVADLLAVISAWGPCPAPPDQCPADVAPAGGDGAVNVADLLLVISNWG